MFSPLFKRPAESSAQPPERSRKKTKKQTNQDGKIRKEKINSENLKEEEEEENEKELLELHGIFTTEHIKKKKQFESVGGLGGGGMS